jgi:F-type H+-transporting ATPase subunit epsilon
MAATTFHITVLTPERTVFAGEAVHLLAPASEGYLGVLAHHAPLLASLKQGELAVRTPDGVEHRFRTPGGFLEVGDNRALVLADACEPLAAADRPAAESG